MQELLCSTAFYFFDRAKIDDPVGAISVHGVCGVWGTLAVGLFASTGDVDGLFYGGGVALLLVQFIGIVIIFVWVTTTAGILFIALNRLKLLRVTREEELLGLDITEHGSVGYGFDINTQSPIAQREDVILGVDKLKAAIKRIFKP